MLSMACQDQPSQLKADQKTQEKKAQENNPNPQKVQGAEGAQNMQQNKVCDYTVKDAKPHWTAYKFTEKAAVGGTFNSFKLSDSRQAPNLMESLKNLSIEIDAASVESNNPSRNKTIAEVYFAKFAPANSIKGTVVSATGDNKQGDMKINIDMNGVAKDVDFKYNVEGTALEANAVIDMMDFKLEGPFKAIHETCKALHTGADGVAKTWTEVALKVSATVDVVCK